MSQPPITRMLAPVLARPGRAAPSAARRPARDLRSPRVRGHLALLLGAGLLAAACADGAASSTFTPDVRDTLDANAVGDLGDEISGPGCGDGLVTGAEMCDGDNLNGASCQSLGYGDGPLACNATCSAFDPSGCSAAPPPGCGNDRVDPQTVEQCDGVDLALQTCQTLGYQGGTLSCGTDCRFDLSACERPVETFCGDGIVGGDEVCDGPALAGATCLSEGFFGGVLGCRSDCSGYDTSTCTLCGNNVVDAGEACDGSVSPTQTCQALGFDDGTLACAPVTCQLDTSGCRSFGCGDGLVDGSEECEGNNLAGQTCGTRGFDGGTLRCTTNCRFDTALCFRCGDGVINGNEVCDGAALGSATCRNRGFSAGTLACASNCAAYDTSGCTTCGNGVVEPGEPCEPGNLAGQTCQSLGFTRGTLACRNTCAFDTSGCTTCGNGTVESGEACEPSNLGGQTCQSLFFDSGTLGCSADCTALNTAGCTRAPHPGPGQLVISEIMVDPTVVNDTAGEWFELHNPTGQTFSVNGCVLESPTSTGQVVQVTLSGVPPLVPGSYLALATSANPGFTPAAVYSGSLNFENGADSLRLRCNSTLVDEVTWDGSPVFPNPAGASMMLSPTALSASANDNGVNWCIASPVYATGGSASDRGTPGAPNHACSSLFFSEYVHASTGNNKAVEIINRGTHPYDLSYCQVRRYSNGMLNSQNANLSGVLAANDVFVLCNPNYVDTSDCDATSARMDYTGNDALELVCAGQVFDVIGRIGEDPGTAWTANGVSTANMTLRRKCSVTSGDRIGNNPFDPSLEWTGIEPTTRAGLGVRECP